MHIFLIGVYSIHRLAYVKEGDDVKRRKVLQALVSEVRNSTRHLSILQGVRNLFHIPHLTINHLKDEEIEEAPEKNSQLWATPNFETRIRFNLSQASGKTVTGS